MMMMKKDCGKNNTGGSSSSSISVDIRRNKENSDDGDCAMNNNRKLTPNTEVSNNDVAALNDRISSIQIDDENKGDNGGRHNSESIFPLNLNAEPAIAEGNVSRNSMNLSDASEDVAGSNDTDAIQMTDTTESVLMNSTNDTSSAPWRPTVCRFHLRGFCRYGSMCLYSHEEPAFNSNQNSYDRDIDADDDTDYDQNRVNVNNLDSDVAEGGAASGYDQDKPGSSNSGIQKNYRKNNHTQSATSNNGNPSNVNGTYRNTAATVTTTSPSTSSAVISSSWVNAPVFIPKPMHVAIGHYQQLPIITNGLVTTPLNNGINTYTWADIVGGSVHGVGIGNGMLQFNHHLYNNNAVGYGMIMELCPYESPCPYGNYCGYTLHWELCEMCDQYCLHPKDENQRKIHRKECLQQHERAMEFSFAIARSKDKTCGICFETIMEKSGHEKRFGILSNCNHVFCLECIRKWRQAKQFENKITRSCPECRVSSDFVCPSAFWVETKEDKDKLLNDYRTALGIKDCKYFKKGLGKCPFGNKCFYKHALATGQLVDVGCPRKPRRVFRSNNDINNLLDIYLYEFLESRELNFLDVLPTSASEDSDVSDYV